MSAHEAGTSLTGRLPTTLWQPVQEGPLTHSGEAEGFLWLPRTAMGRSALLDQESRRGGKHGVDASVLRRQITEPLAKEGADPALLRARDGASLLTMCTICRLDRPMGAGIDMKHPVPESPSDGSSGFVTRVLNQFTLSAWLPEALFAGSVTVLVQFRRADSIDIWNALQTLASAPIRMLTLVIPLFFIAKVLAQAFSFDAIRVLEGYWRKRGLPSLARTLMIRRHVRLKETIIKRRHIASERAFYAAKARMISRGIPRPIIEAFEAQVLQREPPRLTDEEARRFTKMNWRTLCDAWHLAAVDHLLSKEIAYPATSRVLPTKLGNLIRATEDTLENAAGDVVGFALRHYGNIPRRLQMQHDQFRNRLAMFCIMVFMGISLLVLTPIILVGSGIHVVAIGIIAGSFAVFSMVSYLAAIASASGYCAVLRQMDEASRNLDKDNGLSYVLPICGRDARPIAIKSMRPSLKGYVSPFRVCRRLRSSHPWAVDDSGL